MIIKKTFQLLFAVVLFFSCSDDDSNETVQNVQVRLANNSNVAFSNATFNLENFGDLEPGEKSRYKQLDGLVYHYGSVSIEIEGQEYGWRPIDFVEETPLLDGNYTFEYSFDEETQMLTDNLVKDE